jgi:hypothetical protein
MKSRYPFFGALVLLLLTVAIALYTFSRRTQEPTQVFPATISRDCAPWDGSAFTVSIPHDATVIYVSIWQSPSIKLPVTFTLPDETGRVGYAYTLSELGSLEELSGEVFFWRVDEGIPLEGRFRFTTERGERFEGRFVAEWGSQMAYCG